MLVVNVLMHPLDSLAPVHCKALLVNTEFLTAINNVSIAQLIVHTLTNMNIEFNNVLALVSDNAAYMKKCFKDDLCGMLLNAVYVTCWANIVHLVGDEFRDALNMCDLVATMKSNFFEDARTSFSIFTASERKQCFKCLHATIHSSHTLEYLVCCCSIPCKPYLPLSPRLLKRKSSIVLPCSYARLQNCYMEINWHCCV